MMIVLDDTILNGTTQEDVRKWLLHRFVLLGVHSGRNWRSESTRIRTRRTPEPFFTFKPLDFLRYLKTSRFVEKSCCAILVKQTPHCQRAVLTADRKIKGDGVIIRHNSRRTSD